MVKKKEADLIYQLKISLKNIEPAIWRRFQVAGDISLFRLHENIQVFMGWEHDIDVEKVSVLETGLKYPKCMAGDRACPPEDCGGPWGYEEMLEVLKNPKHREYKHYREWLGEDFDPEGFDLNKVNGFFRKSSE